MDNLISHEAHEYGQMANSENCEKKCAQMPNCQSFTISPNAFCDYSTLVLDGFETSVHQTKEHVYETGWYTVRKLSSNNIMKFLGKNKFPKANVRVWVENTEQSGIFTALNHVLNILINKIICIG